MNIRINQIPGQRLPLGTLFFITALASIFLSLFPISAGRLFAQQLSPDLIYKKINRSVLFCSSYNKDGYIVSWGSAVAINSEGIIYTCFHLFNDADKLVLEKDGVKYNEVKIVGADPERDILILKIEPLDFPDLTIGDSDSLNIGETVYALGNPESYKNTFSEGIISAFRNDNDDIQIKKIQYTASTSHGSSGGALFDLKGNLIGITNQMDTRGQNINFAIPINYFKSVNLTDYYDTNQVYATTAYCKGYSNYKSGSYFKANEYFNTYLDMFPENNSAKLQSGQNYMSRGQYDSAIARFNEIIIQDPLNKYAHKLRGDAYSYNNDTIEALANYSKAIELDSNYYSAWIGRAFFNQFYLKKYDMAMVDYNKAIELKPEYTFLLEWRGEVYLLMGDTDKAYSDLIYSVNPEIDIAGTCYNRGILFSRIDRSTEAISDFTNAIKLDPYNGDYYFSRGIEYSKSSDYINAISDYKEAIRLQSINASALNNLAYCHLNLNEYEDAERNFKRAVYFDKHHFDSYLGLAMLSLKKNEKKNCLNYLKKAVEIEPLIKKGIKGIEKLETKGYFWSREEKAMMNEIFKMAGYKYKDYDVDKSSGQHKKAKKRQ